MHGGDFYKQVLESHGCFVRGVHVAYISGLHGEEYVNKDRLFADPQDTSMICNAMAMQFLNHGVEVVVGAAKGGIVLAQWIAYHLSCILGRKVFAAYAEVVKGAARGTLELRRGYDELVAGKRVLLVEDVLNEGTTLRGLIRAVRETRGNIIAATAMCNRGGVTIGPGADQLDVFDFKALVTVNMQAWKAPCPLCRAGVPLSEDLGKGA